MREDEGRQGHRVDGNALLLHLRTQLPRLGRRAARRARAQQHLVVRAVGERRRILVAHRVGLGVVLGAQPQPLADEERDRPGAPLLERFEDGSKVARREPLALQHAVDLLERRVGVDTLHLA